MKVKYVFLAFFTFLSIHIHAQPQLLGNCGRGGSQFGTIFKYTAGDTSLASVFNFPGNPGLGLGELTKVGNYFYGCATSGGPYGQGTLIRYNLVSNIFEVIHIFDYINGQSPYGKLLLASNGKLYGTASGGIPNLVGFIFEYDLNTNTLTVKYPFNTSSNIGYYPAFLMQASNGKIYGTTVSGGVNNRGTLYEYDLITNTCTHLFDFSQAFGYSPAGALFETPSGSLIGATYNGGFNDSGVIYEYDLALDTCYKRFDFTGSNGMNPSGSLVSASGSKLLGLTSYGGVNGNGVLYEYDYNTYSCTKFFDFSPLNGKIPRSSLMKAQNGKYYGVTYQGGISNDGVFFEYDYQTNIFQKILDFSGLNGEFPNGPLISGNNGKLYGTTTQGGRTGYGILFEYNMNSNSFTKKIDMGSTMGQEFIGPLVLATNGKYYGVTNTTSLSTDAIIFHYDYNSNVLTKVFNLYDSLGDYRISSIVQASNGKLYGITSSSGDYDSGTLFEYDIISNIFTKKYDFNLEGIKPLSTLIEASDGNLYGMTVGGGNNDYGVLFQYDYLNDIYTKKFDFTDSSGTYPEGPLFEASDGKLYGMTRHGGYNLSGVIFQYDISSDSFQKKFDLTDTIGVIPTGGFIETSPGLLMGLTYAGGTDSCGTIIQYDFVNNIVTKKFDFVYAIHGKYPTGTLCHASNNKLYGMTSKGAANGRGTIFEFDLVTDSCYKKLDLEIANTGWFPGKSFVEVGCIAPGVTASGPLSFCQGDSVTLTAGGIAGTSYQWNRNGTILPGATGQSLVVTKKGKYSVSVTDPVCTSLRTSHPVQVKIPCIPPFDPQERYQFDEVYVNYNHGNQFVEINANNLTGTSSTIFITDQTGRILVNEVENIYNSTLSKQINCSQFATGIYIVKIITDEEQVTLKFVKEY